MSRVIKLRSWDGDIMQPLFVINSQTGKVVFNGQVKEWPVMQFTGLQDKNGVDIYEGDILTHPNPECKGVVKFGSYKIGDYDTFRDGTGFYLSGYVGFEQVLLDGDGMKIIGNIFQDKHLLNNADDVG